MKKMFYNLPLVSKKFLKMFYTLPIVSEKFLKKMFQSSDRFRKVPQEDISIFRSFQKSSSRRYFNLPLVSEKFLKKIFQSSARFRKFLKKTRLVKKKTKTNESYFKNHSKKVRYNTVRGQSQVKIVYLNKLLTCSNLAMYQTCFMMVPTLLSSAKIQGNDLGLSSEVDAMERW